MSISVDPVTSDPLELADWSLTYRTARGELPHRETLFATANGCLGITGGGFWGEAGGRTYLNGLFEQWQIEYAEDAYGLARHGQSRIEAQRLGHLDLVADGERLVPHIDSLNRVETLDYRRAEATSTVSWTLPSGVVLSLSATRTVSMDDPSLVVSRYRISTDGPVTIAGAIGIDSPVAHSVVTTTDELDPRRNKAFPPESFSVTGQGSVIGEVWQCRTTRRSGLGVISAAAMDLAGAEWTAHHPEEARGGFSVELEADDCVELTVFASIEVTPGVPTEQALTASRDRARAACDRGHRAVEDAQMAAMARYWESASITISGESRVQQALRFAGYHLAQSSTLLNGHGIGAKGMTGEGYEGHCFWDTEIFLVPALSLIDPARARQALEFRYRTLAAARDWAAHHHVAGALFPWRTIDGQEASAYFLAGTAQRHINADIAYAIARYLDATADWEYLRDQGAEILVETARAWLSLGVWTNPGTCFEILKVTGPDEYSALVDNNLYTNSMARMNLRRAVEAVEQMERRWPRQWRVLAERLNWTEAESLEWSAAAAAMKIGYDARRGIHPQDDGFLSLQPIDLADPTWRRPFLLNYHPLFIYSHQILKQADVVMAMNLLGEDFTEADKRANYLFYEPLTTGDSSLSCVGQAIAAARAGEQSDALAHLNSALWLDLANTHGNTTDGLHLAAVAGAWQSAVLGFGGVEIREDHLYCHPRVPQSWGSLEFRLRWRGSLIGVSAKADEVMLRVLEGADVEVNVAGATQLVTKEGVVVSLFVSLSSDPAAAHHIGTTPAVAFYTPDLPIVPLSPELPCPALPALKVTGIGRGSQGTVIEISLGERHAHLGPDAQSAARRCFLLAMTVATVTGTPAYAEEADEQAVEIADWLMELWHSADQEPIALDTELTEEEAAWLAELDAELSQQVN